MKFTEGKDATKKKVYYSPKASQAVAVKMIDKDGNPMTRRDRRGGEVWLGNEPAYISRTIKFECISSSPSKGTLSIYETADPDEIRYLDGLAADPSNDIITEEDYQKSRNKEAFEKAMEVENLKQSNATKDAQIADLQAQLAAAERKTSGQGHIKTKD